MRVMPCPYFHTLNQQLVAVMHAADLEKDCNSLTVCVAIGMFVLGVCGITHPSWVFFPPEQVSCYGEVTCTYLHP